MDEQQTLVMNWRSAMLASIMLCALVALAYLYTRQIERRAVLWLAGFVLAGIVSAIPMVIGFAGAYNIWPGLTFLPTQMGPLYGPLIYLHARALMLGGPPRRYAWLLAPGIVYWLYQVWAFALLGDYKAKWAFSESIHYPYILPVVFATSLVLMAWALFNIWQLRARYLRWLENHRSDDDTFHPVWLSHFILIGVPLVLVWVLGNVLGGIFGFDYFETYWADFVALLLLFFISIEALMRIQQPFPKMIDGPDVRDTTEPEQGGRNWSAEGERIKTAMVDNAWFLESRLSLQDLARYVGSNHVYVSRALNQGLGVSFSNLVNQLRVEHAKSLIEESRLSMLEIALSSGFGSKASFNRAFKLHGGITPSAYRDV